MAPYVPFITESFYLNMRKVINKESKYYEDSIHFLQIPDYKESLIDNDLLPQIERMQKVIEKARTLRDQNKTPIKKPITELLFISKDPNTIEMMKSVEDIIKSEVNVFKVNYTTDWKKYLKFKLKPDFKVLGERLGNDFASLNKKIMSLKEDEVNNFMEVGKITIDGHELDTSLLTPVAGYTKIKEANKVIEGAMDFAIV